MGHYFLCVKIKIANITIVKNRQRRISDYLLCKNLATDAQTGRRVDFIGLYAKKIAADSLINYNLRICGKYRNGCLYYQEPK